MKIPDKVRLNGVDYKVLWVEGLNNGSNLLDGFIDFNQSTISMNTSTQEHQQQCITFLHEICHGILNDYNCSEKPENVIPKDEETLVELFARGFYQFLQDNGAKLFDLKESEVEK